MKRKRHQAFWPWGVGLSLLLSVTAALILWLQPPSAAAADIVVYKSASCGCCRLWVKHLREAGFAVRAVNVTNLAEVRRRHGVAPAFAACHTGVAEGYVFEGHLPASAIRRFLVERPAALGLAVPGMPAGSPGMWSAAPQPYAALLLTRDGASRVYERYGAGD